ncbi:hypothetical protein CGLO_14238 [Colletotrichum gloeosporioides Cg-14]|jgi:hypothetical protein
MRGV